LFGNWSGSILLAKVNHFWFKLGSGLNALKPFKFYLNNMNKLRNSELEISTKITVSFKKSIKPKRTMHIICCFKSSSKAVKI
jgi:hypothetical protein